MLLDVKLFLWGMNLTVDFIHIISTRVCSIYYILTEL